VGEERAKLRAETAAAQEDTASAAAQLAEQEAAVAAAKEEQEGHGRALRELVGERQAALAVRAKAEADVNDATAALEQGAPVV
jgi:septal ring factor EnvC (AmiA/AmiB activator)